MAWRNGALFFKVVRQRPLDFLEDAYLWGNVSYVAAAAGYVVLDATGGASSALLIFLALMYVASAVLYWVSWKGAWPHPVRSAIASEYVNIIASIGYLSTACTYPFESGPLLSDAVYGGVAIAEAILALAFVVDALLYVWAWHVAVVRVSGKRGWTIGDVTAWSHTFNVTPSVLAFAVALIGALARWSAAVEARFTDDGGAGTTSTHTALRRTQQVAVLSDAFFLLDSLLCCACWFRDLELDSTVIDGDGTAASDNGGLAASIQHLTDVAKEVSRASSRACARFESGTHDVSTPGSLLQAPQPEALSPTGLVAAAPRAREPPTANEGQASEAAALLLDSRATYQHVEDAVHHLMVHASSHIRKPLHLRRKLRNSLVHASVVLSACLPPHGESPRGNEASNSPRGRPELVGSHRTRSPAHHGHAAVPYLVPPGHPVLRRLPSWPDVLRRVADSHGGTGGGNSASVNIAESGTVSGNETRLHAGLRVGGDVSASEGSGPHSGLSIQAVAQGSGSASLLHRMCGLLDASESRISAANAATSRLMDSGLQFHELEDHEGYRLCGPQAVAPLARIKG